MNILTLKHQEMQGCVVSTVGTDAQVLKHQAISIHNADLTFIVLDHIPITILHMRWTASENEIIFWKKMTQSFKGYIHKRCLQLSLTLTGQLWDICLKYVLEIWQWNIPL